MSLKVVSLVTAHYWNSERKAGFHWIAESLAEAGWQVRFVCPLVWSDIARRDYRVRRFVADQFKRTIPRIGVTSKVCVYPWRPLRSPWPFGDWVQMLADRCMCRVVPRGLSRAIAGSDIVIWESIPELRFVPCLRRRMASSRFVYRVSDNLTTKQVSPHTRCAENRALPFFDKVSYPNPSFASKFVGLATARLEYHGVPVEELGQPVLDPYNGERNHVVFFGAAAFDYEFLAIAARLMPELTFEIVGPFDRRVDAPNVRFHGEMPFREALGYVKFACIGLNMVGGDGFSGSNKEMIYTYYKLPVLSSSRPPSDDGNVVYVPANSPDLVRAAFSRAISRVGSTNMTFAVRSWSELARGLID